MDDFEIGNDFGSTENDSDLIFQFIDPIEREGYHEVEYTSGTYKGVWKDGERHGLGTFEHNNGYKYEGKWQNDKPHGQGKYTGADGNQYDGGWKDGKMNGDGIYTDTKGDQYTGTWDMNKVIKYSKVDIAPNGDRHSSESVVFGSPKGNHTIEPEL